MGSLKKAAKTFSTNRERWDAPFQNDLFKIPEGRPTRIRLLPEVDTVPTHWVEFFSKKKGGKTGYYELCLNHDYSSEETVDRECPMCALGMRVSNYVYAYAIHRSEQKKGNLQIRPVRLTPKCVSDIIKLTDIAFPDEEWPEGWTDTDGGPDATDEKFGFDIMISRENKNNKIEYPVHVAQGGYNALTKEERRAFRDYVESFPIGEMAKKGVLTLKEARASMERIGLLESTATSVSSAKTYSSFDDDDEEDEAPARPVRKAPKAKAKKVSSLTDDDDRPLPWDDEDEEEDSPERSYATPDEDDIPEDDDED